MFGVFTDEPTKNIMYRIHTGSYTASLSSIYTQHDSRTISMSIAVFFPYFICVLFHDLYICNYSCLSLYEDYRCYVYLQHTAQDQEANTKIICS